MTIKGNNQNIILQIVTTVLSQILTALVTMAISSNIAMALISDDHCVAGLDQQVDLCFPTSFLSHKINKYIVSCTSVFDSLPTSSVVTGRPQAVSSALKIRLTVELCFRQSCRLVFELSAVYSIYQKHRKIKSICMNEIKKCLQVETVSSEIRGSCYKHFHQNS